MLRVLSSWRKAACTDRCALRFSGTWVRVRVRVRIRVRVRVGVRVRVRVHGARSASRAAWLGLG